MNPPYKITTEILQLITSISEKIGHINAKFLDKPSLKLKKENRIKTIHSSLSIEGNTLMLDYFHSVKKQRMLNFKIVIFSFLFGLISFGQNTNSINTKLKLSLDSLIEKDSTSRVKIVNLLNQFSTLDPKDSAFNTSNSRILEFSIVFKYYQLFKKNRTV